MKTSNRPPIPLPHQQPLPERFYFPWTDEENNKLKDLILNQKITNWETIASYLPGRNARQCINRWNNYLKTSYTPIWNKNEDNILLDKIKEYPNDWKKIQTFIPNHSQKQIKNRLTYLHNKIYCFNTYISGFD
jgi:hypothetical protein